MRIIKGNAGGTSPHAIQRRRTTASQGTHAAMNDHRREQRMGGSYGAWGSVPSGRPMSWHPGIRPLERSAESSQTSKPISKNTPDRFQDVNGSTSSLEPWLKSHSQMDAGYAVNEPPPLHGQSLTGAEELESYNSQIGNSYSSYSFCNFSSHSYYSGISLQYEPGAYTPTELQPPDWSQVPINLPNLEPTHTPNFLPIQLPPEPLETFNIDLAPQIPKKASKELVGMGLYDHPDGDYFSNLNHVDPAALHQFTNPHRESVGKGLKLEETWQPPQPQEKAEDDDEEEEAEEEEEEEEEEEAYSTDEAEDELPAPTSGQTPATFYPAYGDLSNQSFFFDHDEHYTNYINLNPGIPVCQPKDRNPAGENFLWF